MIRRDRAIRSICVVGTGIVGLSAGLAFARALPGIEVTLIESPADPAALADRSPATLPTIHLFHAAIGLDELDLIRSEIARHRLGVRFEGWPPGKPAWSHVFGDHGLPVDRIPFHQLWRRLEAAGKARPYHLYSAAGALAEAGKFVHPSEDPASPFSHFLYGLSLDPQAYRRRLAEAAAGLPRFAATGWQVEPRADGGMAALALDGGQRVEADLFVDCTGPKAGLLTAVGARFEPWDQWLPGGRIVFTEAASAAPLPVDLIRAGSDGWTAEYRLPSRTLHLSMHDFSAPDGERAGAAFRPGRRPEPWIRNVLALGDAAVALDPLHGAPLHLAQAMILRAIDLLPGRDCHPLEIAEFNRRTDQEVLRILDFQTLFYLRSGRTEPFWARIAEAAPPPGLGRTLEQFARRGRLPFFEEETFGDQAWAAALLGLGLRPDAIDPVAGGPALGPVADHSAALAARLQATVARFPDYPRLLDRLRATRRRS
ncbi:tryptophan 7-halogenase [Sphingosinicella terrae]|uniref:tryptophan 7-halogenase n=1 Tax=Sphingosinicella terrae TaxID=2172047 RepID=UPI000E0D30FD|nr:tryptophan 7-halogenase [Sphingosinicella terrae]